MDKIFKNGSLRTGFSFGLTSAIITTLGLIIGLATGTGSKIAVIGGVLTIAIADAFSDALGIHLSEESEGVHTPGQIWLSTGTTFLTKLVFALTFAVPVIIFETNLAIMIDVLWGTLLLTTFSYYLAKEQNAKPAKVIAEHLFVAIIVIVTTYYLGTWIGQTFK